MLHLLIRSSDTSVPTIRPGLVGAQRQNGQGMTEYIIIVALVAVAAIAVYQYFGQVVRSQTAAVAKELAGEDGSAQNRSAKTASQKAAGQAKAKTLKSFTGNAGAASR